MATVRRPRSDAVRNRAALLRAAETLFAQHGLGAALEQIAKQAGVSIGTLYRNFPQRAELISAVYAERLSTLVSEGEQQLSEPDAWLGFTRHVENVCAATAEDRGFADLLAMPVPDTEIQLAQRKLRSLGCACLERAQHAGVLRDDLTPEDVFMLFWTHARVAEATSTVAPRVWRRHLHLLLDAYRAEAATPLPEPPLNLSQLHEANEILRDNSTASRTANKQSS